MRILTLISKFPWPLTDGAVIRDFNLLREAAKRHDVSLLCFLFQPSDREQFDALRPYCKNIVGIDLVRPKWRTLANAAWSLVGEEPFITREYWQAEMAGALEKFVDEERIDVVHSHFLHMSQYVGHKRAAVFVHDAHNLEHVLWQRMERTTTNPLKKAFIHSQYGKLVRLQQHVARASEKCVVLSDDDRAEYQRICPEADVTTVPNGADVDYWTPGATNGAVEPSSILYFGNLSWPPQADAAVYFHDKILPRIRERVPDAKFYIVGQNPPETVKSLAGDNVIVTGFVPDMREHVARAAAVVMPLRAGAGTKHRVFQALCMKKPVVCTAVAAEGIALADGETALLADDPETFANATVSLLQNAALRQRLGERGRQLVLDRYDWRAIYERLEEAFQEAVRKRK
ncbi:MAG TPA: glycosyltransferase family 4 protein [Verrucomicrobiae bacterium]|nr:glycosyltransferase family 4 protein [Verrucomicrobiae bacterium]